MSYADQSNLPNETRQFGTFLASGCASDAVRNKCATLLATHNSPDTFLIRLSSALHESMVINMQMPNKPAKWAERQPLACVKPGYVTGLAVSVCYTAVAMSRALFQFQMAHLPLALD
jgi:hypothetical protein